MPPVSAGPARRSRKVFVDWVLPLARTVPMVLPCGRTGAQDGLGESREDERGRSVAAAYLYCIRFARSRNGERRRSSSSLSLVHPLDKKVCAPLLLSPSHATTTKTEATHALRQRAPYTQRQDALDATTVSTKRSNKRFCFPLAPLLPPAPKHNESVVVVAACSFSNRPLAWSAPPSNTPTSLHTPQPVRVQVLDKKTKSRPASEWRLQQQQHHQRPAAPAATPTTFRASTTRSPAAPARQRCGA